MADMMTTIETLIDILAPVWVELFFVAFFALGFALLHYDLLPSKSQRSKMKKKEDDRSRQLHKQLEAYAEVGRNDMALQCWNSVKDIVPAPTHILKMIVQVLLASDPDSMIVEVIEHFSMHRQTLQNTKSAVAVLDVVARAGCVAHLDKLAEDFKHKLRIQPNFQTFEVLLGGHASDGNEAKVHELCKDIVQSGQKLTARGYSLMIKGFLKNSMADAALLQIQSMHKKGFFVPSFALAQLFRTAAQSDQTAKIYDGFETSCKSVELPQEAASMILEDCLKRDDLALALRVEARVSEGSAPISVGVYDSLLKIYTGHAHLRALELFKLMQSKQVRISEGLCVGLLARCADSKFLRFATEVVHFVKSRDGGGMTIAVYSALMKVYAYCGMYDKACDLYAQIRADGIEPDGVMYGCLMRFSVECGRTDLSQELFDKCPSLDLQNYMSLIRAASRDKDVDRAFAVLEKLKQAGGCPDLALYNCVLDACVSAGDMKRANALKREMQTTRTLDIITYNTLLKGHCSNGDVHRAKELFSEMSKIGLPPNDVSYNCLINAAASCGNLREAWNTVDLMEKHGVAVDNYTLSIMMKAARSAKDSRDVKHAMDLLDRSGVAVCSDEVLLNTVLETCIRHRQTERMEGIVKSFASSNLRPSVHTYGSLIKACSTLKRLDKCNELWRTMVEERSLQPNYIVLGCMLDAIVCNGLVEDAVALMNKWKTKVPPNTIMYSTVIKGFANSRQSSRAMDMWREMCSSGLTFNTVVFNTLVDSQARVGAMDEVSKLVESMGKHGCSPDGITYSTIVKGYCIKGNLDKALEVFRNMQKSGLADDAIIYNTLMDGCAKHNRMDLVDIVLEDMEKYKVKPSNFTLGILIKIYGKRRQLDKAFRVLEEYPRKYGLQVNSAVRACLLGACLSNNNSEGAFAVFKEMKESGDEPDAKSSNTVLTCLIKQKHFVQAATFVKYAYGLADVSPHKVRRGPALDVETMEQFMRALQQHELMQSIGLPLLEKLREAKVPISGRLLSFLQTT